MNACIVAPVKLTDAMLETTNYKSRFLSYYRIPLTTSYHIVSTKQEVINTTDGKMEEMDSVTKI